MVPTIAMAIVMGVVPNVFLRPMEPSVKKTIERVTGRSFAERSTSRSPLLAFRKTAHVDQHGTESEQRRASRAQRLPVSEGRAARSEKASSEKR
jgi:hypothetical protein